MEDNPKYKKAMEIAEYLENRDWEENENKYEVYRTSAARYELLAKLAEQGLFNV